MFRTIKILIKTVCYFIVYLATTQAYVLDYDKGGKNTKLYDQVPKKEVIMIKYQALEPWYFSQFPLRGKGFAEPITNEFTTALRSSNIPVYVDYFTAAKVHFYRTTLGYESCGDSTRTLQQYRARVLKNKQDNYKYKGTDQLQLFAIPYMFFPSIGTLGIGHKKKELFKKHLWPDTNVYNVKSMLDDPDLYTVQVTGMASAIKEYIYQDYNSNSNLLSIYKKKVYDFVASNSFQIPLMLKGKRMDWVDMGLFSDFYIKKLNIGPEFITLASLSNTHPTLLKKDDVKVSYIYCSGTDLNKLKKEIEIINRISKKLRTNMDFWTSVLKQYAIDMGVPYVGPKDFYFTKTMVEWKNEIERGDFDLE